MADEIAVDSFLNLLGQSDLLSDEQLLALMAEFKGEGKGLENSQKLAEELVRRQVLTTWQAEMLLQRKHRGFRLGPYRILKPLGQGGMSKVFLAEHEVMRRRCAIKVLPSKYQEDADFLTRFRLEAVAIAQLDHPNIVRAYDFNKDVRYGKEIHYLVMEYVEGPDLRRLVEEQGPLDCRKAADFIGQAAEGLAHAHAAGFVHRDIKPANLLVDPHGVLKVLDLGLATARFDPERGESSDEGEESAVGTADYVAPEQVMDSRSVDGRADIYSLGHTFYFLLTGHRPFSKPTVMELLMAHRTEKPEPIGKFRPDVPYDLEAIIDKMTAKTPLHRYQSAKELAEKLRAWLNDSGSARSYSRISALMAEAMRSKQPPAEPPGGTASKRTEQSELELAMLDEGAAAKTPASDPSGSAKLREAQAKEPPRPTGSSGRLAEAKPQPTGGSSGRLGGRSTPKLSVPPSALPGLPPDDLLSELPPAEAMATLPSRSGSHSQLKLPRPRRPQTVREFLKSPWSLVVLAGAIFVAVILFLFTLLFSLPSQEKTPVLDKYVALAKPQGVGTEAASPSKPQAKKVEPDKPAPDKKATPIGTAQSTEKPSTTAKKNGKTEPSPSIVKPEGKQVAPKPQPVKTPSEKSPPDGVQPPKEQAKTPAEPKPTNAPSPDAENKAEVPETDSPSEEKIEKSETALTPEEKAERLKLLANLQSFCIRMESGGNTLSGGLYRVVLYRIRQSVDSLRIKIMEDDPAVMTIALKTTSDKETFNVMLSAKLQCPDKDGKMVTVWSKSSKVHSGTLRRLDPDTVRHIDPDSLATALRIPVTRFFSQLPTDIRKARREYPPTPAAPPPQ